MFDRPFETSLALLTFNSIKCPVYFYLMEIQPHQNEWNIIHNKDPSDWSFSPIFQPPKAFECFDVIVCDGAIEVSAVSERPSIT